MKLFSLSAFVVFPGILFAASMAVAEDSAQGGAFLDASRPLVNFTPTQDWGTAKGVAEVEAAKKAALKQAIKEENEAQSAGNGASAEVEAAKDAALKGLGSAQGAVLHSNDAGNSAGGFLDRYTGAGGTAGVGSQAAPGFDFTGSQRK